MMHGNWSMIEMMQWWGGMPFGIFGSLFILLWWILLIVGIAALVRWLIAQSKRSSEKSALDILKERYARSEISKQEFEEKKKDVL